MGADLGSAWAAYKHDFGEECQRCDHPEWMHQGVLGSGCCYLGKCRCKEFLPSGRVEGFVPYPPEWVAEQARRKAAGEPYCRVKGEVE